jgi:hypothetical protein
LVGAKLFVVGQTFFSLLKQSADSIRPLHRDYLDRKKFQHGNLLVCFLLSQLVRALAGPCRR